MRILERDRQAQAGSAEGALASRIGTPEPVEDVLDLLFVHSDTVVADADRDRLGVGGDVDVDRVALTVLDRVDHEVAHDASDAHPVHHRHDRRGGGMDDDAGRHLLSDHRDRVDDAGDDRSDVDGLGHERSGAGIVSGDLQQVREQVVEAFGLGIQQLRAAGGDRIEFLTRFVDEVRRGPDRRQRGPQLVRDVRDELPLQHRQSLHLLDLVLEGVGHIVEALTEHSDLVVAVHGHALVEVAVGDEPGHLGARAHRCHDEASDDPGDCADEHDEHEGGHEHRSLHEAQGVLLLTEITEVVELELPGARDLQLLCDEQSGTRAVGQADGLIELVVGRSGAHGIAEFIADGNLRRFPLPVRLTGRDRRERGVRILRLQRQRIHRVRRTVVDRRQLRAQRVLSHRLTVDRRQRPQLGQDRPGLGRQGVQAGVEEPTSDLLGHVGADAEDGH